MNIAALLHNQSLVIGERVAIVERGRTITFAELDRAAASAAAELTGAGIVPGMRALVLSPMSIALYTTIVAMFRLQVTAVFVDPSAGRDRLDKCIRRVRPDAFVGVPRRSPAAAHNPGNSIDSNQGGNGRVDARHPYTIGKHGLDVAAQSIRPCAADTPAIITFTSGSTGEPKAAVRSHGFLTAQHKVLVESLALLEGEVDLTTLPIFLLANLASGVTSVIPDADLRAPAAVDPARIIDQIRMTQPTRTVASPAFLERIAREALRRQDRLDTFRRVFTGGAPVFPKTLDVLASAAPKASIVAVYGSTEAEPIATIDLRDITPADRAAMQKGAGLLAGRPSASITVRILPDRWGTASGPWDVDAFERESVSMGHPGEIVVGGDHVLAGYLDGAGDAETKIKVGEHVWHRTGDAGYLDLDGRLWLLGRCTEQVSDDHGVLYPFAVECAASDIPGISRSAFVQHDRRRVLVVEPDENATLPRERLMTLLAWAHLADVLFVPRIPVDQRHNAKVDYPALRLMLESLR